MGVRFLIGRAGTGKSVTCVKEIRAEAARDPLGGALFWITPEQATFTAERMLLTGGGVMEAHGRGGGVGFFRAQVLSFRRLAALIGREVGFLSADHVKPMDDLARVVLLEEMVRAQKDNLQIFAGVVERPGFIQKLDATLRELRQHGHSGDSLREVAARADIDAVAVRKLSDLALLLDAWAAVMDSRDAWDFEKIMHHAAFQAEKSKLITGGTNGEAARIWVDGFSALSALELRLLAALGGHAHEVTVTLLADPDARAISDLRCAPGEMGLYARTERLYCRLMDTFRKHQVRVRGTTALRSPYRFANNALRKVEADLFTEEPSATRSKKKAPENTKGTEATNKQGTLFSASTVNPAVDSVSSPGVEIWECSDPETEVRIAAQTIRQLVIGDQTGLRFRQIGLIVPDLEGYQDAIRRIFTEHDIPHFIDERRGIAHHPLVELLRSAVAIATSRWDQDEVLLYLKTGLTGIGAEDVAAVENYVIEHGISHTSWSVPWKWFAPNQRDDDGGSIDIPEHERLLLARVNTVRRRTWESLREWIAIIETLAADGTSYVHGLQALLSHLPVEEKFNTWINAAMRDQKDAELAQIHEQVWQQVQDMLAMLGTVLAGRQRSLEEFAQILATALETLTLGLIPPTVDQVLVSSVVRSRVPELHTVLLLGAMEGQFPKVIEEDPILSDSQREFFNEHTLDPIGDGSALQLLEMQFFDYTALTRASRHLIVSYPLADRRGRAVGKSRYVQRLCDLLDETSSEIVNRKFDAASRTSVERIGAVDDLLASVATWARDMIRRRAETLADLPMAALYEWLVTAPATNIRDARNLVWPSIRQKDPPHLAQPLAQRFYPPTRDLRMSVSQLEKFAACPLQYFLHYTLALRPRMPLELDSLNLGVLYHRILERVYLKIINGDLPWPTCDAFSLRRTLEAEVDNASEELHKELAEQTPAYEKMKSRTKRVLGIMLECQRRRACAGDMRPIGVEVLFGDRKSVTSPKSRAARIISLPILRIPTPHGHAVELNGKIDRVDAADEGASNQVAVIDYKSASKKALEFDWIYWGLSLQLPVYAVVMEELAKRNPIAALYVPLGLKREKVDHASDAADSESDAFYQKLEPRGIVDAQGASHLDHAVAPHEDAGEKSAWYKIGYNKTDGSIPKTGDMIAHEDFKTLLHYVRHKIGTMVDDLMSGQIAPAPFRAKREVPCDECDFLSLCPFDRVSGIYRDLPKMKREDVLAKMRADLGEGT